MNRIDYVALFRDLPPEIVRGILERRTIPELQERLRRKGIELEVSSKAIALIAERGFDEKSGARQLQRIVDTDLIAPISRFIPEAQPRAPLRVRVDVSDGALTVEKAAGKAKGGRK